MSPTLKNGRIVLIQKYNLDLKSNDIVVIKKGKNIIIKRLVGMPEDEITIRDYVYVNGEVITEKTGDLSLEDKTLSKDEYFVLGDNRQNSIDSRFLEIGIIKKEEIIGKVLF